MTKIEIIISDDGSIGIGSDKFSTEKLSSAGLSPQVSDSMRPTPNIGDDEDAKDDVTLDADINQAAILDQAAIAAAGSVDLDLEQAGVVWRPAESIRKLIGQINRLAPDRSKASDGTIGDANHQKTDSDHNPWIHDGLYWVVSAVDITQDPAHGCSCQNIVDALISSKDVRIKYIIWNRRLVSSSVKPWQWRRYRGKDPHINHFHLSVVPQKDKYDSVADWNIS